MNTNLDDPNLWDNFTEIPQDGRTFINSELWFVDSDGFRVVFYRYQPIFRFSLGDKTQLRFVAVNLRLGNLATQEEIAKAFGHSVVSQYRWETRFQEQGIEGLKSGKHTGRPSKLPKGHEAFVRRWFHQGLR